MQQAARTQLGRTKPGRRRIDKEAWLWTDEIEAKIREKKRLYHAFLQSKDDEHWQEYLEAKRATKKSIAAAKSAHYDELLRKLEEREGNVSSID